MRRILHKKTTKEIVMTHEIHRERPAVFGALDVVPGGASVPAQERRSSPAGSHALRLDAIGLAFGGVTAVADIDLAVAPGEIRAVIGPNGAGKSSLINIISGIYAPQRGRVWIGDRSFARVPTQRLAKLGIARTFQNLALFKGLSVLDNVAIARVAHGHSNFVEQIVGVGRARRQRRDAVARAQAMVDFLDLGAVRDRFVDTLPYGLQKRVELARALVAQPE
ncbi:MAG: ATP-binding cassette domain-containing protein, partial [Chthoniobacteraceae bacterium]|nr:ATP-binding cassette domain-containing protein [Chthoniobacteraceae bacterium]